MISEDVLKYILAYLVQKPYNEVAEGIAVLYNLPEAPIPEQNSNTPE
jgi:hypothetical protein